MHTRVTFRSDSLRAKTTEAALRCFPALVVFCVLATAGAFEPVPDKTVVLTFDDAVKSHYTFVAPLLQEYKFGATFYVTARWMDDPENFMSWDDIAKLHEMGFEIGNHSWSHSGFGNPRIGARLAGQLGLVENALNRVGVPKPVTFAWCGNSFGPEGMAALSSRGYKFARRGMQPEVAYGAIKPGPLYDPASHHPLLVPSAGDAYPDWTLEDFRKVVDRARDGVIAVVQFHGVPDVAHPWVHTPPERFREYMDYLKQGGFNVIAMRDLERYVDPMAVPKDAMASVRYAAGTLELPPEIAATRADLGYWVENMMRYHKYTELEAAAVAGYSVETLQQRTPRPLAPSIEAAPSVLRVLPYPGGRHPRVGFLDGAVDPLRGTKASVFPPWEDVGYAVVDLPEAIFANDELLFLAHTHVPTIWDKQHTYIDNVDWQRSPRGELRSRWELPNKVRFGARVTPDESGADLELWLENGTEKPLTGLRTQVCVMLKGMPDFAAQNQEGKRYENGVAAAPSADGTRWVLVAFDRCGRTWGNPSCPCIHSDPVLPDCSPGQTVSVSGRLWFQEGESVDAQIQAGPGQSAPAPR